MFPLKAAIKKNAILNTFYKANEELVLKYLDACFW